MTLHDFTLYKHGTLERRVERRMALRDVKTAAEYVDLLRRDESERDQLSRDLLINVTGFFRDGAVFEFLAKSVIPELVRDHPLDRPLRIWIAGCSSGEETYSLAMLFREEIEASKPRDQVADFRDGTSIRTRWRGLAKASMPDSIEAEVSRERLARFFSKEDHSYRISAELRVGRRLHGARRARRPAFRAS